MLRQITKRYKDLLTVALKMLLLLALCTALGFVVVFPLWKFAVVFPKGYTITTLFCIAGIFTALFIKWIKHNGLKYSILKITRLAIIVASAVLCFMFVLDGHRMFCIPVVITALILYGIFWSNNRSQSDS